MNNHKLLLEHYTQEELDKMPEQDKIDILEEIQVGILDHQYLEDRGHFNDEDFD